MPRTDRRNRTGALSVSRPMTQPRLVPATIALSLAVLLLAAGCGAQTPGSSLSEPAAKAAGWRPMPQSPLSARHSATAFWTGREVLVLGGSDTLPCPGGADCALPAGEGFRDGAALEPVAGTWRSLAMAPVPLDLVSGAVLDGTLYLLARNDPGGVPQRSFLAYRINEDRWEELPAPPIDGLLLAAGSRLVAYRGSQEQGPGADATYDAEAGIWRDLPPDPLTLSYDRSLVWTGREVVLIAISFDPMRAPNAAPLYRAASLDLQTGEWRQLPDSEVVGWDPVWFWAGGSIVNPTVGSADGGETNNWGRHYPFGGILTPPAGVWSPLPEVPADGGLLEGLSVGGRERVVSSSGWVLHVPTGRWSPLTQPPERIDSGAAAVWAGDELVVFGGLRREGGVLGAAWVWRP